MKRIARTCGFGSEETLRRSFLRHVAATPRSTGHGSAGEGLGGLAAFEGRRDRPAEALAMVGEVRIRDAEQGEAGTVDDEPVDRVPVLPPSRARFRRTRR